MVWSSNERRELIFASFPTSLHLSPPSRALRPVEEEQAICRVPRNEAPERLRLQVDSWFVSFPFSSSLPPANPPSAASTMDRLAPPYSTRAPHARRARIRHPPPAPSSSERRAPRGGVQSGETAPRRFGRGGAATSPEGRCGGDSSGRGRWGGPGNEQDGWVADEKRRARDEQACGGGGEGDWDGGEEGRGGEDGAEDNGGGGEGEGGEGEGGGDQAEGGVWFVLLSLLFFWCDSRLPRLPDPSPLVQLEPTPHPLVATPPTRRKREDGLPRSFAVEAHRRRLVVHTSHVIPLSITITASVQDCPCSLQCRPRSESFSRPPSQAPSLFSSLSRRYSPSVWSRHFSAATTLPRARATMHFSSRALSSTERKGAKRPSPIPPPLSSFSPSSPRPCPALTVLCLPQTATLLPRIPPAAAVKPIPPRPTKESSTLPLPPLTASSAISNQRKHQHTPAPPHPTSFPLSSTILLSPVETRRSTLLRSLALALTVPFLTTSSPSSTPTTPRR